MIVPGLCPECAGKNDNCQKCSGVGKIAFTIPEDGPAFTRRCLACGWENGMYFPQPGMKIPVDGSLLDKDDPGNCCLECPRDAQVTLIWIRLDD